MNELHEIKYENDYENIVYSICQNIEVLINEPESIKGNKQLMLKVLEQLESESDNFLGYASKKLKNHKSFVLACVSKNGNNLKYASQRLKSDKVIVLAAIKNDIGYLKDASQSIVNMIGDNEPISYLTAAIMKEKIEKKVPEKNCKLRKKIKFNSYMMRYI